VRYTLNPGVASQFRGGPGTANAAHTPGVKKTDTRGRRGDRRLSLTNIVGMPHLQTLGVELRVEHERVAPRALIPVGIDLPQQRDRVVGQPRLEAGRVPGMR